MRNVTATALGDARVFPFLYGYNERYMNIYFANISIIEVVEKPAAFYESAWLIVGAFPSSHDYGSPVADNFDFDIDYFDYIQIYQKNDGQ